MNRWVFTLLPFLWAIAPAFAQSLKKGESYAFLVGCSGYSKTELLELPYTINDIEEFRKALLETGFEDVHIKMLHDKQANRRYLSEKAKILKELQLLVAGLRPEDTLVVALSGHGVHFKGDKTGYFCPVDAKLSDKATLIATEGEGGIFEILKKCPARKKLLLVNACRNDPGSNSAMAARKVEIDTQDHDVVPEGIAALYSCQADQKSYFDPDRKRGIFFDHVIRGWRGEYTKENPDATIEDFFNAVVRKTKTDVDKTYGEPQVPEIRREYKGEWKFAMSGGHTQPPVPAAEAKELTVYLDAAKTVKLELVRIKSGTFTMGSSKAEQELVAKKWYEGKAQSWMDAENAHEVTLTKEYYLGKYHVTKGQFRAFVEDAGYKTEAEKGDGSYGDDEKGEWKQDKDRNWRNPGFEQSDDHPVVCVSWNDAVKFCEWASKKTGRPLRLPSEAEWEHGCRGGSKTMYFFGDEVEEMVKYGNIGDGSLKEKVPHWKYRTIEGKDGYAFTSPVGRFKSNAFGLYDIHGNASQWCDDWFEKYDGTKQKNPTGPALGSDRVNRGGGWDSSHEDCRSAYRFRLSPDFRISSSGFRVAGPVGE